MNVARIAALALAAVATAAQAGPQDNRSRNKVACPDLTRLGFEGNTTVTGATLVTGGTLVTPNNLTLTNLPAFCRVQGLSRPTDDSGIYFEVWLPT